jgi:hypothetical protein
MLNIARYHAISLEILHYCSSAGDPYVSYPLILWDQELCILPLGIRTSCGNNAAYVAGTIPPPMSLLFPFLSFPPSARPFSPL